MKTEQFDDRLFVATLTPYKMGTFEIDEEGFRGHLQTFLSASGPREKMGIIVLPEAGEIFYLSSQEKKRLVEIAMEEAGGKVPVIAGISENTTADAVKAVASCRDQGVDGLFVMPPVGAIDITSSWNASEYPEVYIDLLTALVSAAPELPVVCHPIGGATPEFGIGFPADAVVKICEAIPQVVGWKMTYHYNGFRKIVRALRGLDRHVRIYPSSAPYYHEYLASGYLEGTATGAFNYALKPMLAHIGAWRDGDIEEARRIWHGGLAELQEYVYGSYSRLHVRYKVAAWLAGSIDNPMMRPPMPAPRRSEINRLTQLLEATGTRVIDRAAIESVGRNLRE